MGHAQSPDSVSAPSEAAPAYDHLFEQRPSNPITGYSHIPNTDHDIEHHGHGHEHDEHSHSHNHNHNHTHELAAFMPAENFNDPPPAPFRDSMTAQPHFHCETCDSRQERRERRKSEQRCCLVVAYTFVAVAALIFFAAMMFYFARKHENGDDDD